MARNPAEKGSLAASIRRGPSSLAVAGLLLCLLVVMSAALAPALNSFVGRASNDSHADSDEIIASGLAVEGSIPRPGQPGPSSPTPMVAVTFDDGIDPIQTRQILDILRDHDTTATFFVVGETIAGNEGLLQRMADEGHNIGLHTYNHPHSGQLSPVEVRRQFVVTQQLVLGATGISPTIGRLPYSKGASDLPADERRAALDAQDAGFTMVFSELAPPDFEAGITAQEIFEQSLSPTNENFVLTLHDGGGDRTATIEALPLILDELHGRGYRFVGIDEYGGIPIAIEPTMLDSIGAKALVAVSLPYRLVAMVLPPLLLILLALLGLRFVLFTIAAFDERRSTLRRAAAADTSDREARASSVSILVPAYNEAVGIEAALRSLQTTSFRGDVEIVVVDDGSTDRTAEIAEMIEGVRVIRKPNGGKASALNAGIEASAHEILVLLDGDTIFLPETLDALVEPFTDPTVGAVSGFPVVGNAHNWLTRIQYLEYVIGSAIDRRAQSRFGVLYCVPGAVGAFRATALREAGGLPTDTLAEDTDLTIAIGSNGWRIAHAPGAIAETEAPASIQSLWKQRKRWAHGIIQVAWKHRRRQTVTDGPRTGNAYRPIVVSYLAAMNVVGPLLTPFADFFALLALASGNPRPMVLVWIGASALQLGAASFALWLDGNGQRHALTAIPMALFLRYLSFFATISSLVAAVSGVPQSWNSLHRFGMKPQRQKRRPLRRLAR